ncbi:MAG: hypothetical protein J4A00_10820 [Gammaproteobacteria bacterium]|nr:hypothetical protein [Gammaproteobacteria bacterium]
MTYIVLHNSDSQGERAPKLFHGTAAILVNVQFVNNRISPVTFNQLRAITMLHPGPNTIFWMGHGNEGIAQPLTKGHPLTSAPAKRVHSQDLVDALCLLNPDKIYFLTCMALRWVEREYQRFYSSMSFLPRRVKIFGARVKLLGGALKPTIDNIIAGVQNPSGAFGQGQIFEELEIYGETFIEWQQRTKPLTSVSGFNESPI